MNFEQCKKVLLKSAKELAGQADVFSQIDAETGDGDHGVAIAAITKAVMESVETSGADHLGSLYADVSEKILATNGGSSVALWGMLADGISEAAGNAAQTDAALVKNMFECAVEAVESVTDAKMGDKTMMDALIPAKDAALACGGDELEVLEAAAEAAEEGREKTRGMVARFGRAKDKKEEGIGHLDAGAVSLAAMIRLLSDNARNSNPNR